MKKLRVTIEGKTYDVLVEVLEDSPSLAPAVAVNPTAVPSVAPVPVASPVVAAPPRLSGSSAGDVLCPLTGKLVSIDVKVGDTVQEGLQVATVEAMKMNTYIYAPRSGRVTAILANPGDGVEEGALLLRVG